MGQILHARAKTTHRIREEIQNSQESIRKLASKHNINFKTVLKWKNRDSVEDRSMGAKKLNTVLTKLEEKIICVFRKTTSLPLDDCYLALRDQISNLSRSNLHRCLKRNGLSVLPKEEKNIREKKKFKNYEIGYLHIDITEVKLETKFYIFVAIDRISKFVVVRIFEKQTIENAVNFLQEVIESFPYKIHRILTDNGAQFTYQLLAKHLRPRAFHPFDLLCKKHTIRHKLTKFRHPWTNGQVERFNRTLKDGTVKTYHYDSLKQLEKHLQEFVLAYNFAKRLKSLKFKNPFEFIIEKFKEKPNLFYQNPFHYSRGLNI